MGQRQNMGARPACAQEQRPAQETPAAEAEQGMAKSAAEPDNVSACAFDMAEQTSTAPACWTLQCRNTCCGVEYAEHNIMRGVCVGVYAAT